MAAYTSDLDGDVGRDGVRPEPDPEPFANVVLEVHDALRRRMHIAGGNAHIEVITIAAARK